MIFSITPTSQDVLYTEGSGLVQVQNVTINAQNSTPITVDVQYINTSIDWITVLVSGISGNQATAEIFVDADQLTGSQFIAKVYFKDENQFGPVHTINLTKTTPIERLKTDKANYTLIYNRINNTLSGDLNVNILHNTSLENLNFETTGTLFLEKSTVNNFTLEDDPAFPFSTNSELPTSGTKVVNCRLKKSNASIATSFNITINVVNTNDITADLPLVNFTQYRHLSETKTSVLKLTNPGNVDFNVVFPAFVNVSPTSGNTSLDLTINTENSAVLAAQKYTGDIIISFSGKTLKIPVSVNNIDFIDFPISDYNFCLDDFKMSIQRISDTATRVRIKLSIEIESAEGNIIIEPTYQIAYFNDQATTDIGRKVHQHFPVFSKPIFENPGVEFNNVFIYKPANVAVTIEELDANYDVVFTKTISDIKLFPGKKPKMFPVFSNLKQKRFYAETGHLFSYLTTEVQPSDIVGKTVTNNPFSVGEINSVFFEDLQNLISFGDYKQILGIDFLRIPKGHDQIFVQFMNQNLVPELIVFNGFFQFNEDYTHNYEDAEGFSEKYDSSVIKKAVLQTGYLFKEESKMIEELCKSPLTFIKIENDVYESFPIPGKMTSQNSESNLVIFEIEFLIVIK
ncbi:hypothetical protein [Chryseobacterium sp. YIM B08800]|uniref:hypothetical protein n=1 Tax=Chryseobacterium sp. YIM B08800 TaxID=2984136 RepID=UPI002240A9D6|nr:hypothetical protein [Chryseobacterium sp. YIM B08800]